MCAYIINFIMQKAIIKSYHLLIGTKTGGRKHSAICAICTFGTKAPHHAFNPCLSKGGVV